MNPGGAASPIKAHDAVDVVKWVEEHRAMLPRPLMSHDRVWNDGFLVMLFDGPTPKDRSDFHINSSPEFFYQFMGEMHCRVIENGRFIDFTVGEGEMFLLPAYIPHLNSRDNRSIGLVVHQQRPPQAKDAIAWFCDRCCHQLHRFDYIFEDLKAQLPGFIEAFLSSEKLRTCEQCGTVMPADRGRM